MVASHTWTLVLASLAATRALASPDDFGLGDGHQGPLTVLDAGVVINATTTLTADAAPDAGMIRVASIAAIGPGDLALLYQASDFLTVDSGAAGPFDLTLGQAGRYELVRVASVDPDGGRLLVARPLTLGFRASVSQVVRVPEYTTVTIVAGASVEAPSWDGSTGGVLAFVATGALTNNGVISAVGAGFRGGAFTDPDPACGSSTTLDGPLNARKGEGFVAGRFGAGNEGRGNVANAGGGGNDCNAGGGGGGNAGVGGIGGWAAQSNFVLGGIGGAALTFPGWSRLTFGGGGGAGQGNQGRAAPGSSGGGIVFLRAASLVGAGTVSADGAQGLDSSSTLPSDGAGGAGAGGTISLRFVLDAQCGQLSARGGNGGNTLEFEQTGGPVGPGGGGAGGFIFLQAAATADCPAAVPSGVAGTQPDPNWATFFGAEPDAGDRAPGRGVISVLNEGFDAGVTGGGTAQPRAFEVGCGCEASGLSVFPLALAAIGLGLAWLRLKASRRADRR